MASFHLFPDLPYELREKIWQQAIRPSAKNCSGIQHFSIRHSNMNLESTASKPKLIPSSRGVPRCDKGTAFAAEIPGTEGAQANRSAYMWDAGLWTACWESRQIILRHWEMKKWQEKRRCFLSEKRGFWYREAEWRENQDFCITINAPSLTINDGGEEWQLMVRPYDDAFYFDPKSLKDALKQPISNGHWDELVDIMQDLPFSGLDYGCQPVQHLIFDFDPNWLNNLPRYHANVDRGSPQEFIIDLLWLLAGRRTEERVFHIWLIDRSRRQSSITNGDEVLPADSAGKEARVFYNCDEEFVDLGTAGHNPYAKSKLFDQPWKFEYDEGGFPKPTNILKCDENKLSAALAGEENEFAGWFIWWLAENLTEPLSKVKSYPYTMDEPHLCENFYVEDHISILGYRS
ncbi:unnamed protein product [Clonostachys rhizophaga]|uniref:2EXR domain-containing protein n=1 Tax=Clonostachys rhizophaga TaxID=160324 RepID=A0A9N9VS42_9HYPO|nr:unnamed protein product [Clonostachys rhizophaga]